MAIPFLGLAAHTTLGFRAQLVTARLSARVLRVARHQIKYPEGFNATVTRNDGLGGALGTPAQLSDGELQGLAHAVVCCGGVVGDSLT